MAKTKRIAKTQIEIALALSTVPVRVILRPVNGNGTTISKSLDQLKLHGTVEDKIIDVDDKGLYVKLLYTPFHPICLN